jgi:hypothetical protein
MKHFAIMLFGLLSLAACDVSPDQEVAIGEQNIARAKQLIAALNADQANGLLQDTPNYRNFRDRGEPATRAPSSAARCRRRRNEHEPAVIRPTIRLQKDRPAAAEGPASASAAPAARSSG